MEDGARMKKDKKVGRSRRQGGGEEKRWGGMEFEEGWRKRRAGGRGGVYDGKCGRREEITEREEGRTWIIEA